MLRSSLVLLCAMALVALSPAAHAADWSDTSISVRSGDDFREPHNGKDIHKNILAITYAGGYRYGTQFFNLDVLQSDRDDPASLAGNTGAVELYLIYRNTVDLSKASGRDWGFGAVRSVGITAGLDWNHKNDIAYNSRKRMLVLGPTLIWDVPGHLETSLLLAYESNAPRGPYAPIANVHGRYTYDLHPMLAVTWGLDLGAGWSFEGFLNLIDAKGRDEVGNRTGVETNLDMRLMFDIGQAWGAPAHTFLIGPEYQYWHNKFGNTAASTNGEGYVARTPMLRLEYHF